MTTACATPQRHPRQAFPGHAAGGVSTGQRANRYHPGLGHQLPALPACAPLHRAPGPKGGFPLAGYTVTVSATAGTLDRTHALTDANGEAAFVLTSTTAGHANITAAATLDLPAGSRFVDQLSPDSWQRIVLGQTVRVSVRTLASKDWVESGNLIIAHKFEDRNFNGVQQEDEPNLAG